MGGDRDGDRTGQDPMSSTAEGDDDPGTAALAEGGSEGDADADGAHSGTEAGAAQASRSTPSPPPEAYDDTPVTDAVPESNLGLPEG